MQCQFQDVWSSNKHRIVCQTCGRTFHTNEQAEVFQKSHTFRCRLDKKRYACFLSNRSWRFFWLSLDDTQYEDRVLCPPDDSRIGKALEPFFKLCQLQERNSCFRDNLVFTLNSASRDFVVNQRIRVIDLIDKTMKIYGSEVSREEIEKALDQALEMD